MSPSRFKNLGRSPKTFTDLLAERCAREPLVVLLDEAHTLDKDVGKVLLNASQKVRARAPFLHRYQPRHCRDPGSPGRQAPVIHCKVRGSRRILRDWKHSPLAARRHAILCP